MFMYHNYHTFIGGDQTTSRRRLKLLVSVENISKNTNTAKQQFILFIAYDVCDETADTATYSSQGVRRSIVLE